MSDSVTGEDEIFDVSSPVDSSLITAVSFHGLDYPYKCLYLTAHVIPFLTDA